MATVPGSTFPDDSSSQSSFGDGPPSDPRLPPVTPPGSDYLTAGGDGLGQLDQSSTGQPGQPGLPSSGPGGPAFDGQGDGSIPDERDRGRIARGLIGEAGELLEVTTCACKDGVCRPLTRCEQTLHTLLGMVSGDISGKLARVEGRLGRIDRKILDSIFRKISEANVISVNLGFGLPTQEEVIGELMEPPSMDAVKQRFLGGLPEDDPRVFGFHRDRDLPDLPPPPEKPIIPPDRAAVLDALLQPPRLAEEAPLAGPDGLGGPELAPPAPPIDVPDVAPGPANAAQRIEAVNAAQQLQAAIGPLRAQLLISRPDLAAVLDAQMGPLAVILADVAGLDRLPAPPPPPDIPPPDPAPPAGPEVAAFHAERVAPGNLGAVGSWCGPDGAVAGVAAVGQATAPDLRGLLRAAIQTGASEVGKATEGAPFLVRAAIAVSATAFLQAAGAVIGTGIAIAERFPGPPGCNSIAQTTAAIGLGAMSWLRTLTGIDLAGTRTSLEQIRNAACPQRIPSTAEAVELRLAGVVDQQTARAWAAANGDCPGVADMLAISRRQRPTVGEIIQLWLRGEIDQPTMEGLLSEQAVTDPLDRAAYVKLSEFVPPPTDLVRFMVRDAFDQQAVTGNQFDADFGDKFQGKAKDWARANGMTDEQFRFYWYSHWRMPSPTALYEMLHRQRPGRVPAAQVTTKADVTTALKIDDMAPAWIDRMVAISHQLVGRIDLRRAYNMDVISRNELVERYRDLGYTAADAEMLARFSDVLRTQWQANFFGLPSPRDAINRFARNEISEQRLRDIVATWGFAGDAQDRAVQTAQAKRTQAFIRRTISAIQRRYHLGDITMAEARRVLIAAGVDAAGAEVIVTQADRELAIKGKVLTGPQLCKAWGLGLISAPDYLERLTRMGYEPADAQRIAGSCGHDWTVKQAKALRAAIRDAMRQADRRKRDAAKLEADMRRAVTAEEARLKAARKEADKLLAQADRIMVNVETDVAAETEIEEGAEVYPGGTVYGPHPESGGGAN